MDKRDKELIQLLLDRDFELRRHYNEHVDLERQIKVLNGRISLNADEEMVRKDLQKRKLAGKDRIMEIIDRYRESEAVPAHS